jgi:hypothetical protein
MISTISRSLDTVTVDTVNPHPFVNGPGQSVTISSVLDPGFNGTFIVTNVNSATEFTYSQAGSTTSSSGGLAAFDPTPFYREVIARSCRTCHVAMNEPFNFDHFANVAPFSQTQVFPDPGFDMESNVCGGSTQFERDHMMPNSLITFNRFWLSAGTGSDQPALLSGFYGQDSANNGCPGPAGSTP